jgi:hypothetical protein
LSLQHPPYSAQDTVEVRTPARQTNPSNPSLTALTGPYQNITVDCWIL